MPSPVAHLSLAYFLWVFLRNTTGTYWRSSRFLSYCLLGIFCLASLLPDLDVIPGWIAGDLGRFHNQQTHSLVFAIVASAAVALLLSRKPERGRFWLWWGLLGICLLFHVALDAVTRGRGIRLFWPVVAERVQSPVEIFRGLKWSEGLWAEEHLWTFLEEGLFGIWLFGVGWCLQKWMRLKPSIGAVGLGRCDDS